MERIAVVILGERRSGKSYTWETLFGRKVRTGRRLHRLSLPNGERLSVFLVNGSFEERHLDAAKVLASRPQIVLCSVQYIESGRRSLATLSHLGYRLYVQWLNPGHGDASPYPDHLGMTAFLLHFGAVVSVRSGKTSRSRVREISDHLMGWSAARKSDMISPAV